VAVELKGQTPLAFAVVKNADLIATPERRAKLESEVMAAVDTILGAIGRPCRVHFVLQLPKTRSGKVLRRSIKAIAEGHDPGDLTSLDDPLGIEQIERAVTVR
jgi:propionyl-CoA synthetase